MSVSRYTFAKRFNGGAAVNPSSAGYKIFNACRNGSLPYTTKILEEGERLDSLAGLLYGDSTLWWIIAAASGIGWAMQVPPGTLLFIPSDPGAAFGFLS